VGLVADLLVSLGGTGILSEVTESTEAEHLLAARAASPNVARRLFEAIARCEAVAKKMGVDLRGAQPLPDNMVGGLTMIEEKFLGATAKAASTLIQEFVDYRERLKARGLVTMDTAGNDPEPVTVMVAGGARIILFTTGRGPPGGSPIVPVIKIASNTPVYKKLASNIDFNTEAVFEGEPLLVVVRRIFEFLLRVASGTSAAERWGHRELFAIEPRGHRV
jgi:altronate dehydratase large subunit